MLIFQAGARCRHPGLHAVKGGGFLRRLQADGPHAGHGHQGQKAFLCLLGQQDLAVPGGGALLELTGQQHHFLPGEGEGVEHHGALALFHQGIQGLAGGGAGLVQDLLKMGVGLGVHPLNGGSGEDVVELLEQQQFPGLVHPGVGVLVAPGQGQAAPDLGLPKGQFAFAVALFDLGLGGEDPPVGGEIQLAHVGVPGAALLLHLLKELDRGGVLHPGHALQVAGPLHILDVGAAGAAPAVAIAVGQKEGIQAALLHPVLPDAADLLGVGAVGVAGGQEGIHLRAVGPLPGEVVVGELVALVVGPENLLRNQILNPAAVEDLRQRGRVTKAVRQPQQLAVYAQFLLVEALAVHNLADQRFAAGHVGVGLRPHRALGNPAAVADGLAHALI